MELIFYTEENERQINSYTLTEGQLRYTGHPIECVELGKEDMDRYSILGIEGEEVVTFFCLHKNEGVKPYSNNRNAILLRAFSTDTYFQRKGYAKKALMLLPNFIKENFEDINEIVLAVNVKNEVAQGLYKKYGFEDEGLRKMGKKGEFIIMSYYL
ncbi:GNAT family N-acetyltransferase [Clostridium sp. AL.422]|uniref:GNAT family N-acetyltransferase n=1 Tax=Clostridium TaxID=1485 RepID=UPI00293DBD55|nr:MULTISPECIES: GNAT family N-acetyltransferase [unclassified Clostridium]MDV4149257.1 GNAT family N-acetyltransferase [Clostridium sp. AL.422]